jgi:hypothetical protein
LLSSPPLISPSFSPLTPKLSSQATVQSNVLLFNAQLDKYRNIVASNAVLLYVKQVVHYLPLPSPSPFSSPPLPLPLFFSQSVPPFYAATSFLGVGHKVWCIPLTLPFPFSLKNNPAWTPPF